MTDSWSAALPTPLGDIEAKSLITTYQLSFTALLTHACRTWAVAVLVGIDGHNICYEYRGETCWQSLTVHSFPFLCLKHSGLEERQILLVPANAHSWFYEFTVA